MNIEGVRNFIALEVANLGCVLVVEADVRPDATDILFVVEGDLFQGELATLSVMRRLRDAFPEVSFDVMVLPASRYSGGFQWGQTPRTLFQRTQRHEHARRTH